MEESLKLADQELERQLSALRAAHAAQEQQRDAEAKELAQKHKEEVDKLQRQAAEMEADLRDQLVAMKRSTDEAYEALVMKHSDSERDWRRKALDRDRELAGQLEQAEKARLAAVEDSEKELKEVRAALRRCCFYCVHVCEHQSMLMILLTYARGRARLYARVRARLSHYCTQRKGLCFTRVPCSLLSWLLHMLIFSLPHATVNSCTSVCQPVFYNVPTLLSIACTSTACSSDRQRHAASIFRPVLYMLRAPH